MRRAFPAFLILALASSLSAFADVPMPAGHEAVAFAREAYQSMLVNDLEVDSVLLSRNWRGSFNRVHREKGVAGLMEKLETRLKELGGAVVIRQ